MTAYSRPPDLPYPCGLNTSQPSAARVYDYSLGGVDNFEVDRKAAEAVRAEDPEAFESAVQNRKFLIRVVSYLVDQGIDQFLDIGSGLPTAQNVHQVASNAKVVYVDNDQSVWLQARALLSGEDRTAFICGDVRDVDSILSRPELELLDFSKPVAVLVVALMHFVADADRPGELIEALIERTVPGSYLALSHVLDETTPEIRKKIDEQYADAPAPLHLRSREQISSFFGGRQLEEPGLVYVTDWRPAEAPARLNLQLLGGVAKIS